MHLTGSRWKLRSSSPVSEGRTHPMKRVQKGSRYLLPSGPQNTLANHGKGAVPSALVWGPPGSEAEGGFDANKWA